MRYVRATIAIIAAALLAAPAATSAQQPDEGVDLGGQGWELNAHAGYLNDAPEFQPGDGDVLFPSGDHLWGGRLGYTFGSGLFFQGEFAYSPGHTLIGRTLRRQSVDVLRYGGAVGWNWQATDRLQLFPVVGAGAITWSPDVSASETDLSFNGGGGLRYFLTPSIALRGDARYHVVPSAMEDLQAAVSPTQPVDDETLGAIELSAGVSLFLGGPSDADGDGVRDSRDACPDTPREAEVDAEGCAVDSDGDGVADYRDRCPDTPRGARVDADGCPTDGDGDGVYDGLDECPDTPQGAEVDESGCPTDGDGDGVYDGLDECPRTPAGAEVDESGCVTRVVLDEVLFDFDEASIRRDAEPILREVGRALARVSAAAVGQPCHTAADRAGALHRDMHARKAVAPWSA